MSLRVGFDLDGVLADLGGTLDRLSDQLFGPANGASGDALPRASEENSVASATEAAGSEPKAADDAGREARSDEAGREATSDEEAAESTAAELPAPASGRPLTARQQRALWRAVSKTDGFWETLDETEPGAVARLHALAQARRWEVIFLTERPPSAGDTVQTQSQRWLVRHGFPLPSVFVLSSAARGKVAAALGLDVVVDDRADNCLDVKLESRARPILVWRGADGPAPANAGRLGIEVVASIGECFDRLSVESPRTGGRTGVVGRIKRLMGK